MRKWITLFESPLTVRQVIDGVLAEFEAEGSSAYEVNHGQCFEFADELERVAPDLFQSMSIGGIFRYEGKYLDEPVGFDEALLRAHWPTYRPFPGTTWQQMFDNGVDWPGIHAWAYSPITTLCYVAETPEGVINPFDLPFFDGWKRYVAENMATIKQD